jgi:hypothetical protein
VGGGQVDGSGREGMSIFSNLNVTSMPSSIMQLLLDLLLSVTLLPLKVLMP